MSTKEKESEPPLSPSKATARRPEDWPAEERLRVVREATKLTDEQLGALLRREGLHEAQLEAWRTAADQAAIEALQPAGASTKPGKATSDAKRIRELEKQLRRKEKALAEAAALLVLSKKVRALWGDADDDTNEGNDK